jgi:ATP-grasp ribosomal peptide maturase
MVADRPVAVVTAVDDLTADLVIGELNRRGVPVVRFDPADLGRGLTFTAHLGGDLSDLAGSLRTRSRQVELEAIRAVYWRRPAWPDFAHLLPEDARWAAAQVRHGLGGVMHGLPDCLYVNHPLANHRADFKPLQLTAARRVGFTTPATVISNSLDDPKEFIAAHDPVVHKALRWTPYHRDGVGFTTWTEPVEVCDVDASIQAAPVLMQSRVDKIADVRVTMVGDHVFAVRIDSGLLDWRTDYDALSYRVIDLPAPTERALAAYLEHFGLVFGCFDFCLRHDGSLVFMECNPNGQWGWIEDETSLPITAVFAELLQRGTV